MQAALEEKAQAVQNGAPPFVNPADRANYVQATPETDVEYQRLQNEAATLIASISETDNAIQQSDVDFSILESGVDRIIGAQLPRVPTSPVLKENVVVGFFIGLLIGAALAWQSIEKRRAATSPPPRPRSTPRCSAASAPSATSRASPTTPLTRRRATSSRY